MKYLYLATFNLQMYITSSISSSKTVGYKKKILLVTWLLFIMITSHRVQMKYEVTFLDKNDMSSITLVYI